MPDFFLREAILFIFFGRELKRYTELILIWAWEPNKRAPGEQNLAE